MNSDKNQSTEISLKKSALIAGIALLLMAIIAPIANYMIIQGLVDPEDVTKTIGNLTASKGLFRLGIALLMTVALLDIIVAWALYIFLVPVNKHLSLLTAWLRLIYATMLLVVLTYLIKALMLLGGADYLTALSPEQLNAQVMLSISIFNRGWEFGIIIFGFHLLGLGYLTYKAGYMRRILGILLVVASLGYMIDGLGKLLSADYNLSVSMFTFIGEVVLMLWLFLKGRQIEQKI